MQDLLVASSELWVVEVSGAPATVYDAPNSAAAASLRRRLDSLPPSVPVQVTPITEAVRLIVDTAHGWAKTEHEVVQVVQRVYPGMQRGLVSLLVQRAWRHLACRQQTS